MFILTVSEGLENVHLHDTNTDNFGSHNKICSHICTEIVMTAVLHGKQDKESNHQTEQSHGLRQGKPQDSI